MINRGDQTVTRFVGQAKSVDVCLFTTIITDHHRCHRQSLLAVCQANLIDFSYSYLFGKVGKLLIAAACENCLYIYICLAVYRVNMDEGVGIGCF